MSGRARFVLMLWAAVAAALVGAAAPGRAETWAVLVGVDRYQRPEVSALMGAGNDAEALRDALVIHGGVASDHVFLLTSDAADPSSLPTRSNIAFRLGWLSQQVNRGDSLIVFFSGHGVQAGPSGEAYLLTYEADVRNEVTTGMTCLSAADLRGALQAIPASKLLLLLDACRNDPSAARGADSTHPLTEGFARAVRAVPRAGREEQQVAATVYSCRVGERAYEWPAKAQGFFGYHLVQGLSGEAADPEGCVTLNSLISYLEQKVPAKTGEVLGKQQVPWPEIMGPGAGTWVLAHAAPVPPPTQIITTAKLSVSTDPPGAQVTVDGALKGTTPCDISFDLGPAQSREVEVFVQKEDYQSQGARLTLLRGQTSRLEDVRLEKLPSPAQPERNPFLETGVGPEPLPLPGAGRFFRGSQPPTDARLGDTWISPTDGAEMVFVPAGDFLMGSPEGQGDADEHRQHAVYLDAFWIDKTEVTVAEYRHFCQATGCPMPPAPEWGWQENHPVVYVTWEHAAAYAAWAGKRLPTEAEWEKAARGTDERRYPWGNEWDEDRCANYGNSKTTRPVGSYPWGASPYGCLDMAGNVWEWCADWYQGDYYASAPRRNPQGPQSGDCRVLRGGSWDGGATGATIGYRGRFSPHIRNFHLGFRCARGTEGGLAASDTGATAGSERADLVLVGIIRGSRDTAVLRRGDKLHAVKVGDMIFGLRVETIGDLAVTLRDAEGKKLTLRMGGI